MSDGVQGTINFSAEKVADIGGQAEKSKAPKSGNNDKFENNKSKSSLSDDIKKQARTSLAQIATENGVNLNDGTVEAKFKNFEFDEEQNVTGATVFCDRECQIQAYEANRINADDIARAAMMINIRHSQRQAATVLATEAAIIFSGIQFTLYSTRSYLIWHSLSAKEKTAALMITGDALTLMNGGVESLRKDHVATFLYDAGVKSLRPRMRVNTAPGKPKLRVGENGKPIFK